MGEGDAEVQWLQHLKRLHVVRGGGVAVTIRNAHGKGASHVVDVVIRQSLNADFDVKVAMLDTDTDWNDKTRSKARKGKVEVIAAEPCLEGWLLALHGQLAEGRTSAWCKQAFRERFGAEATSALVYEQHFGKDFIDARRVHVLPLARLLKLFIRE